MHVLIKDIKNNYKIRRYRRVFSKKKKWYGVMGRSTKE